MANKNPLLSWLLGDREEKKPQTPDQQQAEAPVQPETPPTEPQSDSFRLELPPDHAVNKLWRLWREQAGYQSPPLFRFEGANGEDVIPADQAKQELARLLLTVNASANQRLGRIQPKKAGKAQEGEDPPPLPDLDAQAVAFVSNDRLTAWVFVYPPVGEGEELDRGMLSKALGEKQVGYGLDEELLDALPDDPERYFRLYLVARGEAAVHGKDGRIVDLFVRSPERKLVVDEYNRVDYASISFIQNVEEGDVICRIIEPTPGEDGKTVLGQELPARVGRAAAVPKGRNTALTDDGSALVATKTGHVEFSGRTFQVKPVMEIEGNVDYSTGHINFLGDVHVHGDVCTGFTVRAMGNITVDGVVEAASVEAGGDLIMVKGAQGDNRAVLRAGHSIFAKYLENCCLYAMEDLHADCIINCDVYCDGLVEVRSGRGTIIGGSIRAAHEVSTGVLGARSECHTDVVLGGLPCQEFDREVLMREIAELEEKLEKTERQPESPTKFTRMGKLRMQLSLNKNKLEQFDKDLEEQREEQEAPGVRRLTCGVAYPGASVAIGPALYRFQQETRPVSASLVEGEISII
ncbi:MAG: FapA family protein [Oscillospiraceae bacterium]|nr:FapA family protein [Oscillospiraceae bacterium]